MFGHGEDVDLDKTGVQPRFRVVGGITGRRLADHPNMSL